MLEKAEGMREEELEREKDFERRRNEMAEEGDRNRYISDSSKMELVFCTTAVGGYEGY